MTLFKRRTRMISFRLFDDEYKALKDRCASPGVRSLSDFVHLAVSNTLFSTTDRRKHRRYDLKLLASVTVGRKQADPAIWHAHTCNISSGGVLIECETHPPCGTRLHLEIDWPSIGPDGRRLQLNAFGTVVRNERLGTAVRVSKYEFSAKDTNEPH